VVDGTAVRFLAKPFDVDELVAAVRAAAAALRPAAQPLRGTSTAA
jgi:DNA-binding response OmpR family regulator